MCLFFEFGKFFECQWELCIDKYYRTNFVWAVYKIPACVVVKIMAENGIEVKLEPDAEQTVKEELVEHSEDYQKLVEYGIDSKVAESLDEIYQSGKISVIALIVFLGGGGRGSGFIL